MNKEIELEFDWSEVVDRKGEDVEFGACHENYAWRPHSNSLHKFSSLLNAFDSESNSLRLLLQNLSGNVNARQYQQRGRALFAGVWYCDSKWAILCNPRYATLVSASELSTISRNKSNDAFIEARLGSLFENSPTALWRELNEDFYSQNIAGNL